MVRDCACCDQEHKSPFLYSGVINAILVVRNSFLKTPKGVYEFLVFSILLIFWCIDFRMFKDNYLLYKVYLPP